MWISNYIFISLSLSFSEIKIPIGLFKKNMLTWGCLLLNAPIQARVPMYLRPVANHLGVYADPLGTKARRDSK